ncbi:DUF1249 domain-containing protein [Catenovulum sp. SM1970]|nr:DUF1249 domain-containing protein [Marinifaba aquimaris]NTS77699.1 DUF1249 domain-containing protein [Marinifaba aquimaris]
MAICEQNYFILQRLVRDWEHLAELRFEASSQLQYRIKVLTCAKYTNEVEIRQLSPSLPAILQPELVLRVYHDAQVCEVIKNKNIARIAPSYDYPNEKMHQKDEKTQNNIFLNDWLKFCLEQGMAHPVQLA